MAEVPHYPLTPAARHDSRFENVNLCLQRVYFHLRVSLYPGLNILFGLSQDAGRENIRDLTRMNDLVLRKLYGWGTGGVIILHKCDTDCGGKNYDIHSRSGSR